jgi:hypothetical protein
MLRKFCLAMVLALASVANCQADLIAYWNQNSNNLPGGGFGFLANPNDFPQTADAGVGSGLLTVGGGILSETLTNGNGDLVYSWIQSFGGDAQNSLFGDAAGGSISVQGGTGAANNGSYLQFQFSMAGYTDLDLSYATRGTATGFSTHTWSWSTDGTNFTQIGTIGGRNVTAFSVQSFSGITDLDNASTAYLRVTLTGATAATGNNRFDNIQFNATAVPEPTSVAVIALAGIGLLGVRRRR